MSDAPDANPAAVEPGKAGRRGATSRARLLLGLLAALVVTALVVGLVLGTRDDGTGAVADAGPSDAASSSAPPATPTEKSAAPSPTLQPTEPAAGAEELPPALPAVQLDEPVPVEEVTVSLARIEEIQGRASGPGDVAGPALRVTVRIVNETGAEVPLDGVAVNAYYGAGRTPAPPLNDPTRSEFTGRLPAGETVEGMYIFRVPPDQRSEVTIEVGYRPGAPRAMFTGAV